MDRWDEAIAVLNRPSDQFRSDGTPKGKGFLGELKRPDGKISTELSIGVEFDGNETEIPALVPTLTSQEVNHLTNGGKVTPDITRKAVDHAKQRMRSGKSPFAYEGEQTKVDPWDDAISIVNSEVPETVFAPIKTKLAFVEAKYQQASGKPMPDTTRQAMTQQIIQDRSMDELLESTSRFVQSDLETENNIELAKRNRLAAEVLHQPLNFIENVGGGIVKVAQTGDISALGKSGKDVFGPDYVPVTERVQSGYEEDMKEINTSINSIDPNSPVRQFIEDNVKMAADPMTYIAGIPGGKLAHTAIAPILAKMPSGLVSKAISSIAEGGATLAGFQGGIEAGEAVVGYPSERPFGNIRDAAVFGSFLGPIGKLGGKVLELGGKQLKNLELKQAMQQATKETLLSKEGARKFADQFPDKALVIASKEAPSRADIKSALGNTVKMSGEERSAFSVALQDVLTEKRVKPTVEAPVAETPTVVESKPTVTEHQLDFQSMNYTDLQNMARRLGIPHKGITKESMIRKIEKKYKNSPELIAKQETVQPVKEPIREVIQEPLIKEPLKPVEQPIIEKPTIDTPKAEIVPEVPAKADPMAGIPDSAKPLMREKLELEEFVKQLDDDLKGMKGKSKEKTMLEDQVDLIKRVKIPQLEREIKGMTEPKGTLSKAMDYLNNAEASIKQELGELAMKSPGVLKAVSTGERPQGIVELPVQITEKLVRLGAVKLAKGAVKFADWSAEMIKDAGEKIRPHLESLYSEAKRHYVNYLGPELGHDTGRPLPKQAGNVNLERIDTTDDIKNIILNTSKQYEGSIDKARRGTITREETTKLAQDLGMTEADLLKRRQGQAFNAEEALAARDILNDSATRLRQAQEAVKTGNSDEALVNFRTQLDRHAAIQSQVSGMSAEAGRALSSFNILSKADRANGYGAILKELGGREVTEEMAEKLAKIDPTDFAAVNQFVRQVHKAKTSDMVFEAWISSILSGPTTHAANLLSNTVSMLSKPLIESPLAATIEAGRSLLKGKPRERFFGEIQQQILGAFQGIPEGVRVALKAWKTELPADAMTKIETKHMQAIPDKYGGKIIRIPLRALAAADEFSKSIVYRASMNEQAYRLARMKGRKDIAKAMTEILNNPPENVLAKARIEAQYRTFNKPLGKIGNNIMNLRNTVPGMRYVVPFMRTPTNIAKYALERTPLNFGRIAMKVAKGEFKGAEISDELAKPVMGSMMAAATVMLAKQGMITGGGPKESNKREMLYRTGWQPYSVKIGDKYYSYARMEPLSSIIGMAADYSELANETDDAELMDVAEKVMMSFTKNITSKTFVTGLSGLMDAVSDPQRYGKNWTERLAGSVVPTVVANATKSIDPIIRKIDGPVEAIMSRIPGLSANLQPKRDVWGKEIQRTGSSFERFASPVAISEAKNDPVDKELARLNFAPGQPGQSIKSVKLTPEEYDRYSERAGKRAKLVVKGLISSEEYKAVSDDEKMDLIDKAIDNARQIERIRLKPSDKDIVSYVRTFTTSKPIRGKTEKFDKYQKRMAEYNQRVQLAEEELRYFNRSPDALQSLFVDAEKKAGNSVKRFKDGKITAFGKRLRKLNSVNSDQ